jgi:hypothetical protein
MLKTLLLFGMLCVAFPALAQQLPANTCGIVNIYDAVGNRIKRTYFCNNGTDPYPARKQQDAPKTTEEIQQVDALYPNPTTGKFLVTFSQALKNAHVAIVDVNGKTVSRFTANGNMIDFDLSTSPAGIYFIRIDDTGNILIKKVVKQ